MASARQAVKPACRPPVWLFLPLAVFFGYRPGMERKSLPQTVEARGLRCPLPALKLARAVRERGAGDYRLLADDPAAMQDIPALCAERGWQLRAAGDGCFLLSVDD